MPKIKTIYLNDFSLSVSEFHADSGCNYDSKETIYPIAYRTHSHNLGK